ncbi:hypothetical protein N7468_001032 [Penicillium chermesinum]|uniref:DUF4185 domain-containing protein n=1 Tax=Penicillium chermesinum TaxID=63820 RepID=A0A9W9PFT6_9EURO|nr:uncharacterized protein N7468_001032 [Penicillium chermesinum]KAJ5246049.1 hypothetical protein N7468_001032 [Penicillium chermesinum]
MHRSLLAAIAAHGAVTTGAAATLKKRDASNPTVKGTPHVIGNVADPTLNRDSCGSSPFGGKALWVCRDTQPYDSNGIPTLPLWTSSASWTGGGLTMYGGDKSQDSFYPLVPGNCDDNQAGTCSDGTRYVRWANVPPLVTSTDSSGNTVGYTWISNYHISGLANEVADPSVTLYKVSYTAGSDGLPSAEIIDAGFWAENTIPYGNYGGVVQDGTAYLWGQGSNGKVALAKVPVTGVEDISQYQYYVNGAWTNAQPALGDDSATIDNVSAGGQGTYYYSQPWSSYVWIGQASESVSAEFYITTAPNPEGPWIQPIKFYSGVNGNYSLGAYSLQANPALSASSDNSIYLTYTKTDSVGDNVQLYTTPLILVEWE